MCLQCFLRYRTPHQKNRLRNPINSNDDEQLAFDALFKIENIDFWFIAPATNSSFQEAITPQASKQSKLEGTIKICSHLAQNKYSCLVETACSNLSTRMGINKNEKLVFTDSEVFVSFGSSLLSTNRYVEKRWTNVWLSYTVRVRQKWFIEPNPINSKQHVPNTKNKRPIGPKMAKQQKRDKRQR